MESSFRIITLGSFSVGKTSLLFRLTDKEWQFTDKYICTIGVDYRSKNYYYQGKNYHLRFWDTAGQERFIQINKLYFRDSDAVLLIYDISSLESFLKIEDILREFLEHTSHQAVFVLVGNKKDAERQVEEELPKALAKEFNMPWIECSCKTGENVELVLQLLLKELLSVGRSVSHSTNCIASEPHTSKSKCCVK